VRGSPKWADTPDITARVAVSILPRNPVPGVIGKDSSGDDNASGILYYTKSSERRKTEERRGCKIKDR